MSLFRPVAICIFRNNDHILVSSSFDKIKNETYFRPLGGGINFGETSEAAIIREIKEETGYDIEDLNLLKIVENIFVCDGKPGHEFVAIYDAKFIDRGLYIKKEIPVNETGWRMAVWKSIDDFRNGDILYPDGLIEIL